MYIKAGYIGGVWNLSTASIHPHYNLLKLMFAHCLSIAILKAHAHEKLNGLTSYPVLNCNCNKN